MYASLRAACNQRFGMSNALDKEFVESLIAGSELEKLEQLDASGKELKKVIFFCMDLQYGRQSQSSGNILFQLFVLKHSFSFALVQYDWH